MNFLPDDVVPDLDRDGAANCRFIISRINFYVEVIKGAGLSMKDMETMFACHSSWYRNKSLKQHERAMMCALAVMISGSSPILSFNI